MSLKDRQAASPCLRPVALVPGGDTQRRIRCRHPAWCPEPLCPVLSGGSAKLRILMISSDHTMEVFSNHREITVPSREVYPRPMYYHQKRATSWPGDCDAFKLSRFAGQCAAGQQFPSGLMAVSCCVMWDQGATVTTHFWSEAVKPALRCLDWELRKSILVRGRPGATSFGMLAQLHIRFGRGGPPSWGAPAAATICLWCGVEVHLVLPCCLVRTLSSRDPFQNAPTTTQAISLRLNRRLNRHKTGE